MHSRFPREMVSLFAIISDWENKKIELKIGEWAFESKSSELLFCICVVFFLVHKKMFAESVKVRAGTNVGLYSSVYPLTILEKN